MNAALAALRQELARSYGHSQKLTQQGDRLRALVSSLRRDLAKRARENKALKDELEALQRKLEEIAVPPPEEGRASTQSGAPHDQPRAATPAAMAPAAPTAPPSSEGTARAAAEPPASAAQQPAAPPIVESE
jgi:hypothetical protein